MGWTPGLGLERRIKPSSLNGTCIHTARSRQMGDVQTRGHHFLLKKLFIFKIENGTHEMVHLSAVDRASTWLIGFLRPADTPNQCKLGRCLLGMTSGQPVYLYLVERGLSGVLVGSGLGYFREM